MSFCLDEVDDGVVGWGGGCGIDLVVRLLS